MNRKGLGLEAGIVVSIVVVALILVTFIGYSVYQETSSNEGEGGVDEGGTGGSGTISSDCNDGIDNDGDGDIDLADYGCMNTGDDSEVNNGNTQCSDGLDNDNDGDIDQRDSGCTSRIDNVELTTVPPAPNNQTNNQTSNQTENFNILLVSPEDDDYVSGDVIFRYIPRNATLDSCELWGNFNETFMENQTDSSPDEGQENSFSLDLLDGEYKWGIYCNSTDDEIFSSNRTVFIDSVSPGLVLNSPSNVTFTGSDVFVNYTVNDPSPVDCSINYTGASSGNVAQNGCSDEATHNLTGLSNGDYFLEVVAEDYAGNLNSTNVSFYLDVPLMTCGFDSANWNTTAAEEGDVVLASVDGTNCGSESVNYTIYRVDAGGDVLVTQIDEIVFADGVSSTPWTVIATGTQEEYYFNATLDGDGSISLESDLLTATPPDLSPDPPDSPFGDLVFPSPPGEGISKRTVLVGFVIFVFFSFVAGIAWFVIRSYRRTKGGVYE